MKLKISKSLIFTTPWVLAQLQKRMFVGALTILTMAVLVFLSFVYIFVFDIRHWRHFHVLTGQIYFLTLRGATSETSTVGIGGGATAPPPWYLRIGKTPGLPLWTSDRPP